MAIEDIPPSYIDRVVPTSASDYMEHYGLDPENFNLTGVSVEVSSRQLDSSSTSNLCDRLHSKMSNFIPRGAVAVTDVRFGGIASSESEGINIVSYIMFGTAIYPRGEPIQKQ